MADVKRRVFRTGETSQYREINSKGLGPALGRFEQVLYRGPVESAGNFEAADLNETRQFFLLQN